MIEPMTLARPYARAAFDFAHGGEALEGWGKALDTLAAATTEIRVAAMLKDPATTAGDRAQALVGLLGEQTIPGLEAFLDVMADNGRLELLPEVAVQFTELKADLEATIKVEVTSARDVSDEELRQLSEAMAKRLSRSVSITTQTDPTLLGGAVIRAGDLVIDGSVRGRLDKLAGTLTP